MSSLPLKYYARSVQQPAWFVHSDYVLNIAQISAPNDTYLCKELTLAHQLGFKGVVIHVGKHVELSAAKNLENTKN